ncbi:MAG: hypothetical protein HN842_11275 [Gammaproteobacteria bacterium]|jgi:hypothetical protein|nr:hypothetical protein [Gammaproteobacteria bacterium]MBT7308788.1 hypothetical protein [Gammaproteobacteria bacterium]
MIMALVAVSFGISILLVVKMVLSWLLSLSLFKVVEWREYCCQRRNRYHQDARTTQAKTIPFRMPRRDAMMG